MVAPVFEHSLQSYWARVEREILTALPRAVRLCDANSARLFTSLAAIEGAFGRPLTITCPVPSAFEQEAWTFTTFETIACAETGIFEADFYVVTNSETIAAFASLLSEA